MLSTQDPQATRSHCMINYQEFFQSNLSNAYLSFLLGGHYRVGNNSILLNLPQNLFKYILDFVIERRYPILISPDSPTYMRLSNIIPYELYIGLTLVIGMEIFIQIISLNSETCQICVNRSPDKIIGFYAEEEGKEFHLGRKEFADIGIVEGRISRIQSKIYFNHGVWKITDGTIEKPTVNGTWILVGRNPEIIRNGAEIRIADCLLKVNW